MADIASNKEVAAARLKTHVMEMQLQIQRMDERRVCIKDELARLAENEKASRKDLEETQRQLLLLGE